MKNSYIDPASKFYTNQCGDDIVVRYLIKPREGVNISDVVDDFVHEFSGSSWTELPVEYMNKIKLQENYLYDLTINEFSNYAYMSIAFPHQNFDIQLGGIAQLLAIIAGDNISSSKLEVIRVTAIYFPDDILKHFSGPSYGVEGVRATYGIPKAPLLQMILKPRLGLSADDYADIAFRAAVSGVDAIRDDQMLVSTQYCPFYKKIDAISTAIQKAMDITGRQILYYPNITLSQKHMPRVIEHLRSKKINAVTVNAVFEGFGIIEQLRDIASDFIIQAHRSGYVIFSNNVKFSISYAVLAQLLNLAGADEIHIGSIFGRFDVKKQEALDSLRYISAPPGGQKGSFPIISGNVTPAIIEASVDEISRNIIFTAGSGIIGHPRGIEAGVKSIKEMINIVMDGTRIETLISNGKVSKDLLHALHLWGYKRDGVTKNKEIEKQARQILQGKEYISKEYKEKTSLLLDYYISYFEDKEISIIAEALNLTGKAVGINVGQIAEKYVRRLCIQHDITYKQLFSGIEKLFQQQIIDQDIENHLHKIRSVYNKAKHREIFIGFEEALPSLDALIEFFRWLETRVDSANT